VTEYHDVGGLHLVHVGSATYARPDGPFMYGTFTVRSIRYAVAGVTPSPE
jgi:hypothetical protein